MVLADGSPLPEGFALLPLTPHAHFWVFLGLQLGRAGACLASPPIKGSISFPTEGRSYHKASYQEAKG